MLDLSHIPNSQQDIKIFYSNGIANAWQTFQKPRKCQWIWIMAIGGGGGGASPAIGSISGSGGSGAVTRALFNASHLPDNLYIQVGLGGAGAITTNTAGAAGNRSFISIAPNTTAQNVVMGSGTAAATNTGTGETAFTSATGSFVTLANFISTLGVTQPSTGNITPLTSQITTPGAINDGGLTSSGSSILATSISPLIQGGANVVSGLGINGANGYTSFKPFFSLGGAAGGSSQTGTGGNGGNGGIGCGGGSGGSGAIASGNGGNGGDGIVIIITF
jgi:hypothetical protein